MAQIMVRHYLIAIIMFTFIVVGGVSIISEYNKTSDVFTSDERFDNFNNTFNNYDNVITNVDSIKANIENAEQDQSALGVLGGLISVSWNILKTIFTSFGFFITSMTGLTALFNVPYWAVGLGSSIIFIIIGFSIISAIFQRDV